MAHSDSGKKRKSAGTCKGKALVNGCILSQHNTLFFYWFKSLSVECSVGYC